MEVSQLVSNKTTELPQQPSTPSGSIVKAVKSVPLLWIDRIKLELAKPIGTAGPLITAFTLSMYRPEDLPHSQLRGVVDRARTS